MQYVENSIVLSAMTGDIDFHLKTKTNPIKKSCEDW